MLMISLGRIQRNLNKGILPFLDSSIRFIEWRVLSGQHNIFPWFPSLFRSYFRMWRVLRPETYTDANPFKLIWIDPNEIKYVQRKPRYFARVGGGEWDQSVEQFTDCLVYQSLNMHFALVA